MLVTKQLLKTLYCSVALLVVLLVQPLSALAATNAELTNAVITLQRDLLAAKQQISRLKQKGIVIYLDTRGLTSPKINNINLFIDDQPVNRTAITAAELKIFAAGGMKALYSGPLSAGAHELKVELTKTTDQTTPDTKILRFNQGMELSHISITVGSLFKTSKQTIKLEHHAGAAE